MEKALGLVLDSVQWTADDDWVDNATKTIRDVCRYVQQARTKDSDVKWVQGAFENTVLVTSSSDSLASVDHDLAFEVAVCSSKAASSSMPPATTPVQAACVEDATSPAALVDYVHGWNTEKDCAWRAPLRKGKAGQKEYTKDVRIISTRHPDAAVVATWPDGHTADIDDMPGSVYEIRERDKAKPAAKDIKKRPAAAHQEETCIVASEDDDIDGESYDEEGDSDDFKYKPFLPDGTMVHLKAKSCRKKLWQLLVGKTAMLHMERGDEKNELIMRKI